MDLPGYSLEEHLKSNSSKEARQLLQKVSAEALAASRVPRWLVAEYYVEYARRLPSSFINGNVTDMVPEGDSWKLQISVSAEEADSCGPKLEVKANAVVLAMGTADLPETLGIPGEDLAWVTHRPPIHSPVLMEKIGHLLVVGAGLSAADAILHALRRGKVRVTHVFRGKAPSTKVRHLHGERNVRGGGVARAAHDWSSSRRALHAFGRVGAPGSPGRRELPSAWTDARAALRF